MYESSDPQFFRTITGIQSGPDAFDKSRFVMTFLTILGVTEILYSFRFFLEWKTDKEIPELSSYQDSAICQKSQEPSFWGMMDSFALLAYVSFTASRTLLQ